MPARGGGEADVFHGVPEELAIFGHVDRFARSRDELDAVFLEHALPHQIEGAVEGRLAAHGRQQRARAFLRDDLGDRAPVDRLDVDRVRARGVGHDRRGIRVDEDDSVTLLLERLARLGTRVIELARLADDDRTGTDDQDTFEIVTTRH